MTIKSSYHIMAYEVTKTIRGRAYRYRVESVVDPQTGKRRSRWTYLGRVASERAKAATAPRRSGDARGRLLDALERLLADRDFASVTADAIAAEAGLAHGTFYRHFRDKRAALDAALARVREERPPKAAFAAEPASRAEARARLRGLVEAVLRSPSEHPALMRAFYLLGFRDEAFAAQRRERRADLVRLLAAALERDTRLGFADVRDADATASTILAMIDGLYREAVLDGAVLDDARIRAAVELVERAVFGDVERKNAP